MPLGLAWYIELQGSPRGMCFDLVELDVYVSKDVCSSVAAYTKIQKSYQNIYLPHQHSSSEYLL